MFGRTTTTRCFGIQSLRNLSATVPLLALFRQESLWPTPRASVYQNGITTIQKEQAQTVSLVALVITGPFAHLRKVYQRSKWPTPHSFQPNTAS
jgi:hypothetical protein